MMRVTNNMIVQKSKTNINANRAIVDRTNNQMATQKKIVKPSDNPIIAIRSLRLRSALSTITQYYENNIPDTESWMNITETALTNMKDILTSAYEQTVYGTTDSLNQDNRKTILKELQALQQQVYSEGNADYAGRTVFTGYKTNQTLTFINSADAQKAAYQITERFNYKDIDQKKYYPNGFSDTSTDTLFATEKDAAGDKFYIGPDRYEEVNLNRVRLSYDKIEGADTALTFIYNNGGHNVDVKYEYDTENKADSVSVYGFKFGESTNPADPNDISAEDGYIMIRFGAVGSAMPIYLYNESDYDKTTNTPIAGAEPVAVAYAYAYSIPGSTETGYQIYSKSDYEDESIKVDNNNYTNVISKPKNEPVVMKRIMDQPTTGASAFDHWQVNVGDNDPLDLKYMVSDTTSLEEMDYKIPDDTIVFDTTSGELIFKDKVANELNRQQTEFRFTYEKKGFETGELRPEYYFDCIKHTDSRDINYKNYDENDTWKSEAIYYNIAGGQEMQINTEARDVFDSDIRRDMDELILIVQTAIDAQNTVDDIKAKIESGLYDEDTEKLEVLNKWLYEAETQLAYANQNMHDTYKSYITNFQGYLNTVNLAITDIGGRSERVDLTKNRMSIQQSTFKDLKSSNEDMDLSELVINYSAASVAYQAALQAAAKIDKMSLLNYL